MGIFCEIIYSIRKIFSIDLHNLINYLYREREREVESFMGCNIMGHEE